MLHATPLRPIGLWPGKALATITAASYEDGDAGPYNEVIVGIPVVLGRRGGPASLLRWVRRVRDPPVCGRQRVADHPVAQPPCPAFR